LARQIDYFITLFSSSFSFATGFRFSRHFSPRFRHGQPGHAIISLRYFRHFQLSLPFHATLMPLMPPLSYRYYADAAAFDAFMPIFSADVIHYFRTRSDAAIDAITLPYAIFAISLSYVSILLVCYAIFASISR
jgi:hypothetical protein